MTMFGLEELRGIILHELCHYHLHILGMGYRHGDADFRNLLKKVGAPRFCSTLEQPKEMPVQKTIHILSVVRIADKYIREKEKWI